MRPVASSIVLILLIVQPGHAQDVADLLQLYPDSRIVNGHSVETSTEGTMKLIVSHRFGRVNDGMDEFFGLDQATMRIGLDHGLRSWLTIGIGRSTFEKTVDGFVKYRLMRASGIQRFPLSITGLSTMAVNTLPLAHQEREDHFTSRLSYAHQLLIATNFGERFRLQLMPTLVHRNMVRLAGDKNSVYAIGVVPSVRITKTVVLNAEYYYTLPDQLPEGNTDNLAIGIDIETKGHVFTLTFSNSRGMIEKSFVTQTSGRWEEGEIHFGFNLVRDLTLKGRKYQ